MRSVRRSSFTATSSLSTSTLLVSSRAWARIGRSSLSAVRVEPPQVGGQGPGLADERRGLPCEVYQRAAGGKHPEPRPDVEDGQRDLHGATLHRRPRGHLPGRQPIAFALRAVYSSSVMAPDARSSASLAIWSVGVTDAAALLAASIIVSDSTSWAVSFGRATR